MTNSAVDAGIRPNSNSAPRKKNARLDDGTLAWVEGVLANLDKLAASNATVQIWTANLGVKHASQLPAGTLAAGPRENEGERRARKGKNINARMAAMLHSDPAKVEWTAKKWAEALECKDGTVKGTFTWKETIKAARAVFKAERMVQPNRRR